VPTHVALLRGINLGPRNRVAMPRLRELLAGAGYGDVRTLAASGNVVLSSRRRPAFVATEVQRIVAREFGVDTPVIVRTRDELAEVVERNPLPTDRPKLLQVHFLSEALAPGRAQAVEAAAKPPERVAVSGSEIYAYHADGIQRSPLLKELGDEKLGVVVTARNWNTVTGLLELAGGP
jgi:uncharacterized protein (DUF1697 family)